jgi:GDP-4-dehydro-6-deoxy-D-mannose reductase
VNRPVVVTGALGFAGSHLLDLLARQGAAVVACHRPGEVPPPSSAGLTWQRLDILDRQAVDDVVRTRHPASLYHCAGAAHVGSAWANALPSLETNALGTHHVLEAVRRYAPDARVLVPSSALVYRTSSDPLTEDAPLAPRTPYGVSKLAQELMATRSARVDGLHVVVARAFNHVGPRQDASFVTSGFARQIAEMEAGRRPPVIEVGNLEARRDLTDVRDTVRAYALMIERAVPGRPLNVCSGTAYRIRDLLDVLLQRAGFHVEVRIDRNRLRPSDEPVLLGDRARIEQTLDWRPEVSIEQSLGDILDYWRSNVGRGSAASQQHVPEREEPRR